MMPINNIINSFIYKVIYITSIIATLNYLRNIITIDYNKNYSFSKINLIICNLSIAMLLVERWYIQGYFPLSNLYESLIFLSWILTLITISIQNNSIIAAAIISPMTTFIIIYWNFIIPNNLKSITSLLPALKSNWLMMHVSIMLVSYGALMTGCLISIAYLIINKRKFLTTHDQNYSTATFANQNIKRILTKTPTKLEEILDNLSYKTISLGFPLLTLGIISGAVWANDAWGNYWSWDPKETWALITWLIFAAYLHTRINNSWKGEKSALLATIGFIVIWTCYLGVNFLAQGLHSYGSINNT
uniref:Cytochrome c biogenesis protein CcsA n=1 Tax=Cyanidium sp. THAL103 TaxID=3027999 RepID=A0A9Y1I495_9RHOD|nr:cytochrome c biogenesis protein [Cyanidium sp. THAL103]